LLKHFPFPVLTVNEINNFTHSLVTVDYCFTECSYKMHTAKNFTVLEKTILRNKI